MVHREVGKNLAVHSDTLSVALTHKLGIGHTVHTSSSVDTLNPQAAVVPLLLLGAGKPQGSSRGRPGFRGTLWVASRVPSALSTSNS